MRYFLLLLLLILSVDIYAKTNVKQQAVSPNKDVQTFVKTKHNKSSQHNVVWLDSVTKSGFTDEDNDGYSQTVNLTLDLDTNNHQRAVFIELFLVDDNDHATRLITSRPFELLSDSTGDKQRFDIEVDSSLSSGFYHFLIKVYDENNKVLINTIDFHHEAALSNVRLEGHNYDHHETFSLHSHSKHLSIDNDNDGYYQRLEIKLDIDSIYQNQQMNVQFMLDNVNLFHSRPFSINGTSTGDTQTFDLLIPNNFISGSYNLSVRITELNNSNNHHAIYDLGLVAIESAHNDKPLHTTTYVRESGSLGIMLFLILAITLVKRFRL